MEELIERCGCIPVAEILSLIDRQKEIIKTLSALIDLRFVIEKERKIYEEKEQELTKLFFENFNLVNELENAKELKNILIPLNHSVKSNIQIYDVFKE